MSVSLHSSVRLYSLILHIISSSCDKCKSLQWNLCWSNILFVFQCRHLAITKCSPRAQYRAGHNHSVAWVCRFTRLCSQKQIMHLLKMCRCKFFIAQEVLCIEVTFPTCSVLAKKLWAVFWDFLWMGIAGLTENLQKRSIHQKSTSWI